MPPIAHEVTTPSKSIERLQKVDTKHSVIRESQIEHLSQGLPFNADHIEFQIGNAVKYTAGRLPEKPTVADVEKSLTRLVRTVDNGGKLHATLTHAMGINKVQDRIHPLPGLPEYTFRDPNEVAVQTKRELAVVQGAQDAVKRAINGFRIGLSKEEYHHVNEILSTTRHSAPFFGEVLGRHEVEEILDIAEASMQRLRSNALQKSIQIQENLPNEEDTKLTKEQNKILDNIAHGFVLDMVRDAQRFLRSNDFFFHIRKSKENPESPIDSDTGQSLREIEREKQMTEHINSIINELDVDKEPLRFATAWVTDEHYKDAHNFIERLPSFNSKDLDYLKSTQKLVDFAVMKSLQTKASPTDSYRAASDEAIEDAGSNSIMQRSVVRAGLCAGMIFLHLKPHYYPIPSLRRVVASRAWLGVALLMQADPRLATYATKLISRPVVSVMAPKGSAPERMILNSIRQKKFDAPPSENESSTTEQAATLYCGFENNMNQIKQNLPAQLYL